MNIIGTGSSLPEKSITNDMLSEFLDTNDTWIASRTGIRTRRIITTESLADLAADAANKALSSANMLASDIDFLLCSNVANNFVTPSLSCIVQGKIDANCPCIDLNGACAGFVYALDIAESYIASGKANNVLIVCAEEPTRFCDWKQRDTSVLFGDGAAAVVVSKGNNLKSIHLTTSSKTDVLYYQRKLEPTPYTNNNEGGSPLVMSGKDVFKMAVQASLSDIKLVMEQANINANQVDLFLLHQANIRILDSIRQNLNEDEDKFPSNIEKYGNTSSASIPILLDELYKSDKLKDGYTLVLSAFGAGFTTGACVLKWGKENIV